MSVTSAVTLTAALLGIGTTDTLISAFFFTHKLAYNRRRNCNQYYNYNSIYHNRTPKI